MVCFMAYGFYLNKAIIFLKVWVSGTGKREENQEQ